MIYPSDIYMLIRTAPRSPNTFANTLKSALQCPCEITVIAEPGCRIRANQAVEVRESPKKQGAFENFKRAASVALSSDYNYFLICEDDVEFSKDAVQKAAELVNELPNRFGCASLYLSNHCAKQIDVLSTPGWVKHDLGWNWWGSVALLFSRLSLSVLLGHDTFKNHRSNRHVDAVVMRSFNELKMNTYTHVPSLVQHTGIISSIKPGLIHSHRSKGYNYEN